MTKALRRPLRPVLAAALLAALLYASCGSEPYDRGPAYEPDPTPERIDGSESHEFEEDDLDTARDAGVLVERYCQGAVSEAQFQGCLAHVTADDVCAQDTGTKADAVQVYIEETGDDAICE